MSQIYRPYYYKYAQEKILCDCPLCWCPSRDRMHYGFAYVCERRNILYFDIAKCASTTIQQELFYGDHSYSLVDPKKQLGDYLKFSFECNWRPYKEIPWFWTLGG